MVESKFRVVLKFEDVLAFWSIGWGEQTAFFFPALWQRKSKRPALSNPAIFYFIFRVGWRVLPPPIRRPILDSELSKARLGEKGRNPRILKPAIFVVIRA